MHSQGTRSVANGFARRLDDLPLDGIEWANRPAPAGDPDVPMIVDLTEDSRQVGPGSLFVARRGGRFDGRAFVDGAIAAGAVAILTDDPQLVQTMPPDRAAVLVADDLPQATAQLAESFFGSPSQHLQLVGVTGTNGKTTITHAIRTICRAGSIRCGLIGTINNDDGARTERASLTTPMAIDLSRTLGRMVTAGCDAAAIEVSSHGLDQRRVGGQAFRVGVFTNLTGDHLDYHRTMDTYADAKAMLFASLDNRATAIVNADDPWHARMIDPCCAHIVRCSMVDPSADAHAMILSRSLAGMHLRLDGPWGSIQTRTPMLAPHDAMNLLQAACAASALGLNQEQIAHGLEAVTAPTGRLERINTDSGGPAVFVDFAHTDDALERSARALASLARPGRLWIVFGCGGDRDATKRPRMGRVARAIADRLIITSDNPRTEDPGCIIEQILVGVGDRTGTVVEPDRRAAIARAIHGADECDVVLIAGRGHEREQLVADGAGGVRRLILIDQDEARSALRARGASSERCA